MTTSDKGVAPAPSDTALPEPVRDHLGQQLRAVYAAPAAGSGPQFLGDEAGVPDAFQPQIRRLETRLKTHEEGTDAVEHALDKILDAFGVAPVATDPPAKRS